MPEIQILIKSPMHFLAMILISIVLTELVKFPIKKFSKKCTAMGWLYILISVGFLALTYWLYSIWVYPLAPQGFVFDGQYFLGLLSGQQLTYNFIWDKGISKLLALIIAKFTKKKVSDVEKTLIDLGVDDALKPIDNVLKENKHDTIEVPKSGQRPDV